MQAIIPFIIVILFFITYIVFLICFIPLNLENSAQFGDSFGAINSLFTGLGFAGLVTTIILQIKQTQQNRIENQKAVFESNVRSFESTLFKLLDLYKDSIESLMQSDGNNVTRGLEALRKSCDHVSKKIIAEGGSQIPTQILKRYEENKLSEDDKILLNSLFQKNLYHLNFSFNRQGRYISTLTSLLNHLEVSGPAEIDRDIFRKIILSQMTAIEIQYIFFYCLGVKNDDWLRDLVLSSGLINKFSSVKKTKIQKIIYKEFWNYEIKNIRGKTHDLPKGFYKIDNKKHD